MTAKRSRTGCQTCRKRKLKCDEVRPQCGQCIKSRRECVPSDGIAFRHEQNASMTGAQGLENFFKYREAFNEEQKKNFVPIPKKLTFIHIEDPYAEEPTPINPPTSPGSYQQVAAHTLEALSTAASGHPAFSPSVSYADYNHPFGGAIPGRSGYGPAGSGPGGLQTQNNQNNNINFLLNHSGSETPANFIDPNLEIAIGQQMDSQHEDSKGNIVGMGSSPVHDKSMDHKQHADEQLAALLQGVDNEMTA